MLGLIMIFLDGRKYLSRQGTGKERRSEFGYNVLFSL
jgi:hypothetical protein